MQVKQSPMKYAPIQAYLRIRPAQHNNSNNSNNYLRLLNDTEIEMIPPKDSYRNRITEKYKFTKVLEELLSQELFFQQTTWPFLRDLFEKDENALIFAYGVTNSGKTFTVMGNQDEPGILPRSLESIFKAIKQLKCHDCKWKPFMHSKVQAYSNREEENRHLLMELPEHDQDDDMNSIIQEIHVDDNYRYSIWISFIEVYNEKIYDLLVSNSKQSNTKRKQLALKYEGRTGNKYIHNDIKVRVHSIQEALQIMEVGQKNRQVYSTLMNQSSSRSHSIFTIHIVKCPVTEEGSVIQDCARTVKMSIVDLAGSERYKNTNSSGDRLKEAGNINKSLMVLGQCMETLRSNQWKLEMGKPASIVPFRQSKLTELFKSTFQGDGKVAIIVNINPMETGFDENSHVMKFAAVAKDVKTWQQIQPKLDLESLRGAVKRFREEDGEDDEDEDEWDYLVNDTILEIEHLKNMLIESDGQRKALEIQYNAHCLNELTNENNQIKKEIESKMDEDDQITFERISKKQDELDKKLDHLQTQSISQNANNHQSLLDKISQLETQYSNQKKINQRLEQKLEKYQTKSDEDEEDDHSVQFEDMEGRNTFDEFLILRKQLRRSIFKREELSEDADEIMNQVEKFEGVTFKLAKETKMGKLLKLIAQEDFESDPYQIKTRATNLFKRYARLPVTKCSENTATVPQESFSNMSLGDSDEDHLKTLSRNQNKLKKTIEKTRRFCHLREKNQSNYLESLPKRLLLLKNTDDNSFTDESDTDNSQFTELFKQKRPPKRKRYYFLEKEQQRRQHYV
ncbi:kinesin-domain-containing protein [Backusella circina FSU 941]|nr:kinesin-domain-containing protein [Backusella circina FSU 941]